MSVPDDVFEKLAEAIYARWSDNPEFVPWTPYGNSLMQDKARRQARLQLADALSALEAARLAVVPVEPTEAMIKEGLMVVGMPWSADVFPPGTDVDAAIIAMTYASMLTAAQEPKDE